jgi:hypothetical protein
MANRGIRYCSRTSAVRHLDRDAQLSGKGFTFGDRDEFVPKGFDEGVPLWDVRWRHE